MSNGDGASLAYETAREAVKAVPPVGVTGTLFLGLPLSEWLVILTIIYTALQIGYLVWNMVHKEKAKLKAKIEEAESGS